MQYATPPIDPHRAFDQTQLSSLDNQPYGCIKVDKIGRVQEMNVAASAVLGVRARDAVGKCFFTEVAPCANTPAFFGLFKSAMAGSGVLNKVIDHRFLPTQTLGAVPSIDLRVHLFSSTDAAGLPVVWIVTRKKPIALPGANLSPANARTSQPVLSTPRSPRRFVPSISTGFDELM